MPNRRNRRGSSHVCPAFAIAIGMTLVAAPLSTTPATAAMDQFVVSLRTDDAGTTIGDGVCEGPSGACTLREAIREANARPGPAQITLAIDVDLDLIGIGEDASATGDLDITDDLVILGDGYEVTQQAADRVLDLRSGAVVTIDHLALRTPREVTVDGGLVRNVDADLVLITTSPNVPSTTGSGGALWNGPDAHTRIGDTSRLMGWALGEGGVIYNEGVLELGAVIVGGGAAGSGGDLIANYGTLTTLPTTPEPPALVAGWRPEPFSGVLVTNHGTLDLTARVPHGSLSAAHVSVLDNWGIATVDLAPLGDIPAFEPIFALRNHGIAVVHQLWVPSAFEQGSTIANDGVLTVPTGGTANVNSFAAISGVTRVDGVVIAKRIDLTGGMLLGAGEVWGDVTNSGGVITPWPSGSTFAITGDYTQKPNGNLSIDWNDSDADLLLVGGAADLDGTLQLLASALPPPMSAPILRAGSLAGEFAQVVGTTSPPVGVYKLPTEIRIAQQRYGDVPTTHTFFGEIDVAAVDSLLSGYHDGTFKPTNPTSRQAFAAVLYRLTGAPDGDDPTCAAAPFVDVPVTNAFCGEIAWAKNQGLMTGYADGLFRPANTVTRQSAAIVFVRLVGVVTIPEICDTPVFTDVTPANRWCGAILGAVQWGLFTGYPDGTFRPTYPITRQALAALLTRYAALT